MVRSRAYVLSRKLIPLLAVASLLASVLLAAHFHLGRVVAETSFPAPDVTALVISNLTATVTGETTATITWTTDEAAISQVEYGLTDQYGSATTLDPTAVTSHSVNLTDLTAGTTYHYRVKSKDASSNEAQSEDYSFTTLNSPPNQPSNISPANAAKGISLTPTLTSSTFSDPDAGDSHAASQWQIRVHEGSYSSPVFDSGTDTVNLTNIDIPAGSLGYSNTYTFHGYFTYYPNYYWHVRYQDSHAAWSDWSAETIFNTAAAPDARFSVTSVKTLEGAMSVFFTNWSWGGVSPLSYAWDFDNDGTTDATEREPWHRYMVPGTYTVSLTITDAAGDTDTKVETNCLTILPPEGGRMETADGQISVEFPSGAVAGTAVVTIQSMCEWFPGPPEGFEIVGNTCFVIMALDENGSEILTLSQPATVTVKYSDADLAAAGGDAENLVLVYCDRAVGEEWKILDTVVDAAEMTLSTSATDLTSSMSGRGWGMWVVMVAPASAIALWIWIIAGIGGALIAGVVLVKCVSIKLAHGK